MCFLDHSQIAGSQKSIKRCRLLEKMTYEQKSVQYSSGDWNVIGVQRNQLSCPCESRRLLRKKSASMTELHDMGMMGMCALNCSKVLAFLIHQLCTRWRLKLGWQKSWKYNLLPGKAWLVDNGHMCHATSVTLQVQRRLTKAFWIRCSAPLLANGVAQCPLNDRCWKELVWQNLMSNGGEVLSLCDVVKALRNSRNVERHGDIMRLLAPGWSIHCER